MATAQSDVLIRHIRKLVTPARPDALSDGELLRRFAARRDEGAFAALVRRHGPMVLSVCRRVLHNRHDAEDAFQGAFLTLARKAASLRWQDSVGSWVYLVAYRQALRVRAQAGRRAAAGRALREGRAAEGRAEDPLSEVTGRELSRVLDEELSRLPEKCRAPLVLCYLEGATRDEAAQQLGWAVGTLKHRLEKGRALLRARLARRGLALSAALPGALLVHEAARAAVPAPLVDAAVRAAVAVGATGAAAVVGGALRAVLATRLRVAALLLLTLAAVGVGAALLTGRAAPESDPPTSAAGPAPQARPPAPAAAEAKPDKAEELAVAGRVFDPDGKPAAGAEVAVVTQGMFALGAEDKPGDVNRLQTGKADADGRFRLPIPPPAGARPGRVWVLAAAPDFGFGWSAELADALPAEVVVRLRPEQVLRGRVLDVEGQPVAGAKVHVARASVKGTGQYHNPASHEVPWPKPVTTDAEGRFVLRGTARDVQVTLDVTHDRFTPEWLDVEPRNKERPDEVPVVLTPARTFTGRVVAADTGKPVARARLHPTGYAKGFETMTGSAVAQADDDGRFSVRPYRGGIYQTAVIPPAGQPYLAVLKEVPWPKGVVKHDMKLELPRGALARGAVTDEATGKPIAGAAVSYVPAPGNPNVKPEVLTGAVTATRGGADGAFRLTVLPGAGYLLVAGPTPDYVHRQLYSWPGYPPAVSEDAKGLRLYPDGFARLDLKADDKPVEVKIALRRGVTVEGKLVGPDGKPVLKAKMLSPLVNVHPGTHQPLYASPDVRDGTFRLRGCDPDKTFTVCFLDAENELGAAVEIAPKKAGKEPVMVRLAACGSATGRLLRRDGTPLKDYPKPPVSLRLELVLTPGTPRNLTAEKVGGFADVVPVPLLDPGHYRDRHTDDEGRITFPALIPGATYRLTGGYDPKEGFKFKDFKVESGKRLDLSDLKLDW